MVRQYYFQRRPNLCIFVAQLAEAACRLAVLFLVAAAGSEQALGQPYDPAPQRLRVMTWNVEWMFDDNLADNLSSLAKEQSAPTQAYWQAKRDGVAAVLAKYRPEIVALQEIENERTLAELVDRLKAEHALAYRWAFIPGSDHYTEQDVGLLLRHGLVNYRRHEQSKAMFASQQFFSLSKHLVAEFRWDQVDSPLTVMTVHMRAKTDAEPLRVRQAALARHWLLPHLQAGQDVILLGDFNFEDLVSARAVPSSASGGVAVLTNAEQGAQMLDVLAHLPNVTQATHAFLPKQFDRIFISQSLMVDGPGQDWCFTQVEILADAVVRGARDAFDHWPRRLTYAEDEFDLSDHHPVMATFELR